MLFLLIFRFYFFSIFPALCECGNKQVVNSYSIYATVKGLQDNVPIYLIHSVNDSQADTVAKTKSKNGSFSFKGKLNLAGEFYYIKLDTNYVKLEKGQGTYITLLLDDSDIKIKGFLKGWPKVTVQGSQANNDYNEFQLFYQPIERKIADLQIDLNRSMKSVDSNRTSQIKNSLKKISDSLLQRVQSYIHEHPNSLYSPFLIMKTNQFDVKKKEQEYDKLSYDAKDSFFGRKLKESIETKKIQTKVRVGEMLSLLKSSSIDGNEVTIQNLISKNKLTLIDFWASWCRPCRAETPNLIKVYESFHDKGFNIISVSFDFDRTRWIGITSRN